MNPKIRSISERWSANHGNLLLFVGLLVFALGCTLISMRRTVLTVLWNHDVAMPNFTTVTGSETAPLAGSSFDGDSAGLPEGILDDLPGLWIRFEGFDESVGQCVAALYGSAESFNVPEEAVERDALPIVGGTAHWHLEHLEPGDYAVAAFHDANANGRLDTNADGIPTEGYGFSNDRLESVGTPEFSEAAFSFTDRQLRITVRMQR